MLRFFGTLSYVLAGFLALIGAAAFLAMVFGLKDDAMAAVPAFMVAQPWASIFPFTPGNTTGGFYANIAGLGVMLAINPLILFGLGRWLRKRAKG